MIKVDFSPSPEQLRQFGLIALFGFPLMGVMILWKVLEWEPNWVFWALTGLGPLTAGLALIHAPLARPIYILMMLIAIPIGFVISAVFLRLIYYLVFTPIALWFKITGKDAMHRKFDPNAGSYWLDHPGRRSPASYFRLY